ncbi:DUF4062 domain-containing protein [Phycisphaeraceae bacterium D3-23]
MASGTYIKVMISSRCGDKIEYGGKRVELSEVRQALKKQIEALRFIGDKRVFTCWINEQEAAREGTQDAWDECLQHVKQADIVLCIYNGNAGWATSTSGIGVCHAELLTAMSTGAVKLRLIQDGSSDFTDRTEGAAATKVNVQMKKYVDRQNLFRSGRKFTTGEELIEIAVEALTDGVIEMTRIGSSEGRSGRYDSGEALDWSRLGFQERKTKMESVLRDAVSGRSESKRDGDKCYVKLGGHQLLTLCHAIPAAFTIASAREMVGMPFLRDHEHLGSMATRQIGPVHLIACHKAVTESQAMKLLGFPDALFVETSFGIYVADKIQKIQLLLLKNCRDEAATLHAVQRAFDWLNRSGEAIHLGDRAKSRKRIIQAISKEQAK